MTQLIDQDEMAVYFRSNLILFISHRSLGFSRVEIKSGSICKSRTAGKFEVIARSSAGPNCSVLLIVSPKAPEALATSA